MKLTKFILLAFVFTCSSSFGQKYKSMIEKRSYKFSEIQKEANLYFDTRDKGKGSGFKQWKRWEFVHKQELDEQGFARSNNDISTKSRYFRNKVQQKSLAKPGTSTTGSWSEMGPVSINVTSSWSAGVGRVTSIGVDQSNQNHIIVGANTGGVWKTTDGGSNWSVLTDNFSTLDVTALEISPTNSNTYLWGSNGEIYKSIDAGVTWSATNISSYYDVVKIIYHPTNSNIVFAACEYSGVYKSIDGGENWTSVPGISTKVLDIEFKTNDPNTIITSGEKVLKSTDGGASWTEITGFTTGSKFLGVTAADPNRIYVLEANSNKFGAFYVSTDGGSSFVKKSHSKNYLGYNMDGSGEGGQAPRDQDICVSPTDADEVHIAGINIWKSTDGGTTFDIETHWIYTTGASVGYTHADIDILKYHGNTIYVGSDGGFFTSTNKGASFTDKTIGLGIRQFYRIGVSKTDPNVVTGGSQDNGSSVLSGSDRKWKDWLGADGMEGFVDWSNANTIYGTSQLGGMYKSINQGNNYSSITAPPGQGAWVTPFEQDPTVSNTIYVGYKEIYKSTNQGGTWSAISSFGLGVNVDHIKLAPTNNQVIWAIINNKLKRTTNGGTSWTDIQLNSGSSSLNYISPHPTDENKLAICTSGGVYVTSNGGATWTDYKKNLPSIPLYCVQWQNNAKNGLYVGGNGIVMYIEDGMTNWINFMDGLPNVKVFELEINYVSNKIFAGTYGRGLWESDIYGVTINDESVSLEEILEPSESVFCWLDGQKLQSKIKIKNSGANNLTSLVIKTKINDVLKETLNWTGSIITGGTEEIQLTELLGITAGNNKLTIEISAPNGQTDPNTSDNTLDYWFTVKSGKSFELQFTADQKATESNWYVKDASNTTVYYYNYSSGLGEGVVSNHDLCLPQGCYTLHVEDAGSDGLTAGTMGDYRIIDPEDNSIITEMTTSNFGSATVHNFCINTTVFEYDAAIQSINGTSSKICGIEGDLTATIKNAGSKTLTSVVLKVYVNGTLEKTINHSTNLIQGGSENVIISDIPYTTSGTKSIEVKISSPNGQIDQYLTNNSKTSSQETTVGELYEFYIADRSYNSALTWELKIGTTVHFDNTVATFSKTGNDQIQEFCLTPACYDFEITDAFISGGCASVAWNSATIYQGDGGLGTGNGEIVSHNGKEWRALWWTQGNEPGTNSTWLEIGNCNVTYDSDYYGIRKKGETEKFEVLVVDYISPNSTSFCSSSGLTVDFSANKTTLNQCENISFSSNITGGSASSISWNFGNGASPSSATGTGPHIVKYSTTGSKTVTLNADGTIESKTNYITVNTNSLIDPAVAISLIGSPVCENEAVSFSNVITNEGTSTSFSWKVNNTQVSTLENYSFTTLKNGDKVLLNISTTDLCGTIKSTSSAEITMSLSNNPAPTINIHLQNGESWPICSGGSITLEGSTTNGGGTETITWYVNSIQKSIGTSFTFNGNSGDIISAKVNSTISCLDSNNTSSNNITAVVDICTDVNDLNTISLKVYPNPAKQYLTIEGHDIIRVRILDMEGRLVDINYNQQKSSKFKLDVSDLLPGIYFIQVTDVNGIQSTEKVNVN